MRVLLAVIGNDVHVVANRLIDHSLLAQNYTVANLGVACKPNEIIDGAKEFNPQIIIISSLNGEAEKWSRELILDLRRKLSIQPTTIVGGNLLPRANSLSIEDVEGMFTKIGFDYALDHRRNLSDLEKIVARVKEGNA